jgi:hypothetical protein
MFSRVSNAALTTEIGALEKRIYPAPVKATPHLKSYDT